MDVSVLIPILGALVAAVIAFAWWRSSRPQTRVRTEPPIPSTTGTNRTLTGVLRPAAIAELDWDEALRRFVAYALDDAPRAALSAPPNPEHAPVFTAVSAVLERIEARPEYIPRRPALLPKLLATVNDGEATMHEMGSIIAQDPALTGNLLRIANSPLYKVGNVPVESIDRAVTLVGVQGIRAIIAIALLQPVMTTGSGPFGRFAELAWDHTLYAALAAETHSVQVEHADPFVAQLVGLLYGLSAVVVFRIVRDQYAAQAHLNPEAASVARLLEKWVAPTAARIAANWELSQRVQYALESQTIAAKLDAENALGRSLRFGRVAGALAMLCRLGRLSEADARAILVAGDDQRRGELERLWDRFSASFVGAAG